MVKVKIEISCDEYLPDFLYGKLGRYFEYVSINEAKSVAEDIFNRFIKWLENDPSCIGKPDIKIEKSLDQFPMTWYCNIHNNDAWFKVTIEENNDNYKIHCFSC